MNKAERAELRKLVDRRMATLKVAIETRSTELHEAAGRQIEDLEKGRLAPFRKRLSALKAAADKLKTDAAKLQADAEANSVEISGLCYERVSIDRINDLSIKPADLRARVTQYLSSLRIDQAKAQNYVAQLQYNLHEQLLVGALTSEDAKEFLASIPTVDKVLGVPAPLTKYIEHKPE